MKNLGVSALLVLPGLLFSSFSQASWIGNTTVVDVRWYESQGFISVEDDSNPECPGAAPTKHKLLSADHPGHEQIMTMALAAMLSGSQVKINLSGCQSNAGNDYSVVRGIVVNKN